MGDPLRLYGLKALVLSAGSGIGEATARTLVKHGAKTIALDGKNSGVEQLFSRIRDVEGLSVNLRDAAQLNEAVETAAQKLGGIDILVIEFPLNAEAPFSALSTELSELLNTRTELTNTVCKAAMPHLLKSPAGRIVNIGMLRSCFSASGDEAQAHAEQDLQSLTSKLATECGPHSITVNYVQPGAIMTPVSRDVFRKDTALRDFCISKSAAKRLGEPVDVAKVVLFLASDESVFVSGTGIRVDGGSAA